MNSKPWYESKTMWVNILTVIISILGVFAGQEWITNHPALSAGIVTAVGVLNVILRSLTNAPVTRKRE